MKLALIRPPPAAAMWACSCRRTSRSRAFSPDDFPVFRAQAAVRWGRCPFSRGASGTERASPRSNGAEAGDLHGKVCDDLELFNLRDKMTVGEAA